MRAPILFSTAGVLLFSATALGAGVSGGSQFSRYTLQLSDLGRAYKQTAAHPVSNAAAIKQGTPAAIVRRFGRVGGYQRRFDAKNTLQSIDDLESLESHVTGTRTAAGSHGAFVWSRKKTIKESQRLKPHFFALTHLGDESSCFYFDTKHQGYRFRALTCQWRQGRLVGTLIGVGFWGRKGYSTPLIIPFRRALARQTRRMALFR